MSAADYFNRQNKVLGFDYFENEKFQTGNPFGHPEMRTVNAPEYRITIPEPTHDEPVEPSEQYVPQDTDLIRNIGIGVGATLLLAGAVLAGPRVFNVARQGLTGLRTSIRNTASNVIERSPFTASYQAIGRGGRERIIQEAIIPPTTPGLSPFRAMQSRLAAEGERISATYNRYLSTVDEIEASLPPKRMTGLYSLRPRL